ncbi:MAG: hypothetical protein ACR2PT_01810 [Endozoicomonas sp.]
MKQQLYLLPDLDSSKVLASLVEAEGIPDNHIHIAHKDHTSIQKYHLNDLTFIEEFDTIHAGERGLMVGTLLAVLAGLSLYEFLDGHPVASTITLFSCLILLGFSTWLGGLIGSSSDNYRLQPFHDHLQQGGSLIMIDVKTNMESRLIDLIKHAYPLARPAGTSSTIDNPFSGEFFLRKHF